MVPLTATLGGMSKAMAELALTVALIFGVAGMAHCNQGCLPAEDAGAIDAAYRAELVGCAVTAKTLAESKECRRQVNARYGLCERTEWPRLTPCDE